MTRFSGPTSVQERELVQGVSAYAKSTGKKPAVAWVRAWREDDGQNTVKANFERFKVANRTVPSALFSDAQAADLKQWVIDQHDNGAIVIVFGQSRGGVTAALAARDTGKVDVLITSDPAEGGPFAMHGRPLRLPTPGAPRWRVDDFRRVASAVKLWIDTVNAGSLAKYAGWWGMRPAMSGAVNLVLRTYPDVAHGDTGSNLTSLANGHLLPLADVLYWPISNYVSSDHGKTWHIDSSKFHHLGDD